MSDIDDARVSTLAPALRALTGNDIALAQMGAALTIAWWKGCANSESKSREIAKYDALIGKLNELLQSHSEWIAASDGDDDFMVVSAHAFADEPRGLSAGEGPVAQGVNPESIVDQVSIAATRMSEEVTPSCGCVFCDLDLAPDGAWPDGVEYHLNAVTEAKVPCLRAQRSRSEPCSVGVTPKSSSPVALSEGGE
jgi:hypothetical protein